MNLLAKHLKLIAQKMRQKTLTDEQMAIFEKYNYVAQPTTKTGAILELTILLAQGRRSLEIRNLMGAEKYMEATGRAF